jgi:hypothetical protein
VENSKNDDPAICGKNQINDHVALDLFVSRIFGVRRCGEFRGVSSNSGPLLLHQCPALDQGPDWVKRERISDSFREAYCVKYSVAWKTDVSNVGDILGTRKECLGMVPELLTDARETSYRI